MSDPFGLSACVIKEEVDSEPWGALPLGDEEYDMWQQGAALSPVKHEIDIEEHDLLQHPRVRAMLASRADLRLFADNEESLTSSPLTPTVEASPIKLEEESLNQSCKLFSSTVVLKDCWAELQQSGRFCQECRVQFSSCSTLVDHASSAHDAEKQPFMCDLCSKIFVCKNNLALHFQRNHRDSFGIFIGEPLESDLSENICSCSDCFKYHLSTQAGEKTFKCGQCEYRCSQTGNFKRHLKSHTGENPDKCGWCVYRCSDKSKLKEHLKTHTEEKPFKCGQCEYRCNQRSNLKTHLKTHTGEKPFKCGQCEYRSSKTSNLKRHLKAHTGEKPYKCDQCEYRCSNKSTLKYHLRMHTGEKPFKCDQCEYRCSYKSTLKYHLRMHTGEKPLNCGQCEYRCSHKSILKKHLRTHTGEKPFECGQCDYKFSQKGNLKRHLKTHRSLAF